MRFSCSIFLGSNNEIAIPATYRKNFLSLIKEILNPAGNPSELFLKYYPDKNEGKKKNVPKPFTFSVYLPIKKRADNYKKGVFLLKNNRIEFFPLFSGAGVEEIKAKNFHLKKEMVFNESRALFKPYSPVLVRKTSKKEKEGKTEFISKDEKSLKESLFYNIRFLTKTFLNKELSADEINIDFPNGVKAIAAITYSGEIGINGLINIEAPVDVLKLVYYAGLGAKRSQGYGMLGVAL